MFKFSSNEIRDLFISFLVISLAFSLLHIHGNFNLLADILPIVMVGVGLGFIFHEVAHKITAMKYGHWAEYKTWPTGLFIALVSSMFGFIFAAPGAVYISGQYIDDRQNGIISIAGPLTNIILSLIFLAGAIFLLMTVPLLSAPIMVAPDWAYILFMTCSIGFSINAVLALFNLIPFSILDGAKVFRWDPIIWLVTAGFAGILVFIAYSGALI